MEGTTAGPAILVAEASQPEIASRCELCRGLSIMMSTQIDNQQVAATDSDIILESCDNVHFKVHRVNLRMHSDIFADAEDISSSSVIPKPIEQPEIVSLSESSAVLDLLLQYMYRQPPPELADISFELLAGLAEAAEKYRVYYAIDGCKRAMRYVPPPVRGYPS